MSNLLSVDKALERMLNDFQPLSPEEITLDEALGRVLSSDIVSRVNIPAFANASMDGFAVRAEETTSTQTESPLRLPISMDIPAGTFPEKSLSPGTVARIMTGAPIPDGANAVIPVELTDAFWTIDAQDSLPESVALKQAARRGDNIRLIGEDIQIGQVVIQSFALKK